MAEKKEPAMAEKKKVLEKEVPADIGTAEATKDLESERAVGTKAENKFTKEQLLASKRFRERRDLVAALLTDGEQYTVRDLEQKIDDYMKGKVK